MIGDDGFDIVTFSRGFVDDFGKRRARLLLFSNRWLLFVDRTTSFTFDRSIDGNAGRRLSLDAIAFYIAHPLLRARLRRDLARRGIIGRQGIRRSRI